MLVAGISMIAIKTNNVWIQFVCICHIQPISGSWEYGNYNLGLICFLTWSFDYNQLGEDAALKAATIDHKSWEITKLIVVLQAGPFWYERERIIER